MGGRQVSGECWVDLGEVTSGLRINTKLTVFNSGLRAAFITATCYPGTYIVYITVYLKKFMFAKIFLHNFFLIYVHRPSRNILQIQCIYVRVKFTLKNFVGLVIILLRHLFLNALLFVGT